MGDIAELDEHRLAFVDALQEDDPTTDDAYRTRRHMAKVVRRLPVGATKKKKGTAPALGSMEKLELTLPTERSTPSDRIGDFTTLIFGEKKIGKTDLTAQMDSTFHMMTEPGGKALSILQRPVNNWREFQAYVKLLEKDKKFKTATVDTADFLYGHAFDYVAQKQGFEHPSEEAYGKGWKAIRDEFTKWVLRLINTGKGVVFISHATEKEVKMRSGEKYDRIQPTMAGQAMDVLTGLVDLWFYYGYDGDRRVLTIQGSDHIGAGHRLKHNFHYIDGTPVKEIDMGSSAEEGYANLMLAFHNKLPLPPREEPTVKKAFKLKKKQK